MELVTAREARAFYHKTLKNADGTPQQFRRNGATKTWKREPSRFSVPVKRGMREYGYITEENIGDFTWS